MAQVLTMVQTYINTYAGKGPQTQSAYITFSFDNRQMFRAEVPIKVLSPATANLSAGAEVYIFRSTDGGATYETELTPILAFTRPTSGQTQIKDALLDDGQYLVAVLTGGGSASTWSVDFGATARLITAMLAT